MRVRLVFTTVASSSSPKPSCAEPIDHALSLKFVSRHAVPRSAPVSWYFQIAPAATSVAVFVVKKASASAMYCWRRFALVIVSKGKPRYTTGC